MICYEGGLMQPDDSGYRLTDDWREDKHKREGDFRNEGIFERFIKQALDVLISDVKRKKLQRYCRYLHRELRTLDYKYTEKLSEIFRELSKDDYQDIQNQLHHYRQEIDKPLPHRIEFFKAINDVFNLQHNILFEDYLYELRNYGTDDRLAEDLQQLNNKIIRGVILNNILKLNYKDQRELERKLRRAVREYRGEYDDPYDYKKVLESGTFPPRRSRNCQNGECEARFFLGVDVDTDYID